LHFCSEDDLLLQWLSSKDTAWRLSKFPGIILL
jgi:hypothetical protein